MAAMMMASSQTYVEEQISLGKKMLVEESGGVTTLR